MNNSTSSTGTDAAKNYSTALETELKDIGTFTFAEAKAWAELNGKTWQSVVAKIHHMGLTYIPKPKAESKRVAKVTKAEIVAEIETQLRFEKGVLSGLEKGTAKALVDVLDSIRGMQFI